jgi:hypothetical protein
VARTESLANATAEMRIIKRRSFGSITGDVMAHAAKGNGGLCRRVYPRRGKFPPQACLSLGFVLKLLLAGGTLHRAMLRVSGTALRRRLFIGAWRWLFRWPDG